MGRLLSDRAEKTADVVVLAASLEDPNHSPPGVYRVFLLAICGSIFALFASLIIAYYWRSRTPPFWEPIALPPTLWFSTGLLLVSSVSFEWARRVFRRGNHRLASHLFVITACLGAGFLSSQITAWRELVRAGVYLAQNPHSSFFYLFTGFHAAHVVGGMVMLLIVLARKYPRRELVDVVVYYWHFLGVLWLTLFAVLLLIT